MQYKWILLWININLKMNKFMKNVGKKILNFFYGKLLFVETKINTIQSFESDKILIPTIRKAFECMKYHFLITSVIASTFYLSFLSIKDALMTLLPFFISIGTMICLFGKVKLWLKKILREKKVIMATNIYFISNLSMSIALVYIFSTRNEYCETE